MATYDLNGRQRIEVFTIDQWGRVAGSYPSNESIDEHKQDALRQFLTDNGQSVQPTDVVTIVYHDDSDDMPVQLTWGT